MKVLIACEESQEVCKAFRLLGHEAFSCDIQECSGGYPEWHIQGDVLPLLQEKWDLIIAHPPCTYLTVAGNRWFKEEKYGEKAVERKRLREEAVEFFMKFARADCEKIAIENPIGIMSTRWRKPDQIINPYNFGDPFEKRTCLWLKGLPLLHHTKEVQPEERKKYDSGRTLPSWYANAWSLPSKERAKIRSKTFTGMARAMAEQWGGKYNE